MIIIFYRHNYFFNFNNRFNALKKSTKKVLGEVNNLGRSTLENFSIEAMIQFFGAETLVKFSLNISIFFDSIFFER